MAKRGSNVIAEAFIALRVDRSGLASGFRSAQAVIQRSTSAIGRIGGIATQAFSVVGRTLVGIGSSIARFLLSPLSLLKNQLLLLAGVGGIGALGAASIRTFATFEQSMARVRAITGATDADFQSLEKEARRLGAETAFSATQAATAMGNFAVAGFSVQEIFQAMEPTLNLAAAGQLDMATSSDIVAKVLRGMQIDATDLSSVVDVLTNAFTTANTDLIQLGEAFKFVGPNAAAAGATLEEMTAAIQLMSDAGIQGGMAGTTLRNMLLRLQTQPSEVKKALEELRVEVEDDNGKLRSLADIVDQLNTSMEGLTPIQQQSKVAAIAGARAFAGLNTILAAGGDKLRDYTEALGKSGTAQKIADIQLDTLSGRFKILMSVLSESAIAFGEQLAPAIDRMVEAFTQFITKGIPGIDIMKELANLVSTVLVSGFEKLSNLLGRNSLAISAWEDAIASFLRMLAENFNKTFAVIREIMTSSIKVGLMKGWELGLSGITGLVPDFFKKEVLELGNLRVVNPFRKMIKQMELGQLGVGVGIAGEVEKINDLIDGLIEALALTTKRREETAKELADVEQQQKKKAEERRQIAPPREAERKIRGGATLDLISFINALQSKLFNKDVEKNQLRELQEANGHLEEIAANVGGGAVFA